MNKLFDFSAIEKNERAMQNTWAEFRQQLASGVFSYDDLDNATQSTFLHVFNDLFQHGHRFLEKPAGETLSTDISIVRAARLKSGAPVPGYSGLILQFCVKCCFTHSHHRLYNGLLCSRHGSNISVRHCHSLG